MLISSGLRSLTIRKTLYESEGNYYFWWRSQPYKLMSSLNGEWQRSRWWTDVVTSIVGRSAGTSEVRDKCAQTQCRVQRSGSRVKHMRWKSVYGGDLWEERLQLLYDKDSDQSVQQLDVGPIVSYRSWSSRVFISSDVSRELKSGTSRSSESTSKLRKIRFYCRDFVVVDASIVLA
jgi:hypothetical protein